MVHPAAVAKATPPKMLATKSNQKNFSAVIERDQYLISLSVLAKDIHPDDLVSGSGGSNVISYSGEMTTVCLNSNGVLAVHPTHQNCDQK